MIIQDYGRGVNPYPNRPYPVGELSYEIKTETGKDSVVSVSSLAMLEYGEQEVLYDMPRIIGGGNIANLGHARGGSLVQT